MKVLDAFAFRCLFFVVSLLLPTLSSAAIHARLVVGNEPATCPRAQFTKIQDAVNAAAPGDDIFVCNGVYQEQVAINKPLGLEGDTGAFLVPSGMQQNASGLASGNAIAAAILVSDAAGVSIRGLSIDGIANGVGACSPRLMGVYFRNSSGELRHVAIRNFKLGGTFNGCQSGTGVFVESGGGGVSAVEIANCSIHDFQKNGITANEAGTTVQIHDNVVTGLGPITGAAQNGIQIGFAAAGVVQSNIVTNNLWAPCTEAESCQAVATNILVVESDNVEILRNTAGIAQIPIFVAANHATVRGNTAFAATVFENIRLEGDSNTVERNEVYQGGEADIFLQGNNNVIQRNRVTEAPIGILKATGSVGNIIANNDFFNVAIQVQDPVTGGLRGRVQPER